LIPEILAHFFCPSGKFFLEKIRICVRISTILPLHDATKSAKLSPVVIGVLSPAAVDVEKSYSFSYLG
jgi:hypothetical protein